MNVRKAVNFTILFAIASVWLVIAGARSVSWR